MIIYTIEDSSLTNIANATILITKVTSSIVFPPVRSPSINLEINGANIISNNINIKEKK